MREKIKIKATAFVSTLLAGMAFNNAAAQTDSTNSTAHRLDNVDVIGTRKIREVTSTAPVHMLTQEQFGTFGITDIADALNRLPGITLRDYGGAGGMKTVSVRGFGTQHTGVSYDGIMLSDCQSGDIDISRYSLDNVARISLTIGDNDDIFVPAKNSASAAVLSIQTFPPPSSYTRPRLTAQVKTGSFGYVSPFIKYEQSLSEKFAISATGEYIYAENDYPFILRNISIVTHERRTNSRMNQGHGEMNFTWMPDKRNMLTGKAYYYDNDRQLPGQVRYYTNISNEQLHDRNAFAQLLYSTRHGEKLSMMWFVKYNYAESVYTDGTYGGGVKDATYRQREAYTSICVLYAPASAWAVDYSADYSFNNLSSSLPTDIRPFRHTVLQSLTGKYRTARVTATTRLLHSLYLNDAKDGPGARNTRRLSPSVSVSYKILNGHELYLRASYKNIFRSPTFNESYFFHYGSTDLLPESTDQYNIGVTWSTSYGNGSGIRIIADGYVNHVKDKIVAVPYNMFVWTNINVGKVLARGFDATLNATHRFGTSRHSLSASASYSHQRVENHTNPASNYYKNQLAYIPIHSGSAAIGYDNPWICLSLHATGMSSRYANNEHYDGTKVNGYVETGITAYRQIPIGHHRIEIRADAKNIFNKQYELVARYPMPGRSYTLSLNYKL